MMEKMIGKGEPAYIGKVYPEVKTPEEIEEMIRTIRYYLEDTRKTLDRVEAFVKELKEEQEKAIDELTPVKTAKKTIPQQGRSI